MLTIMNLDLFFQIKEVFKSNFLQKKKLNLLITVKMT